MSRGTAWSALEADYNQSKSYKQTKIRFWINGKKYQLLLDDATLAGLAKGEHTITPVVIEDLPAQEDQHEFDEFK